MIKKLILLWSVFGVFILNAQEYFPKNDGVNSKNTNFTAFTNAKIFITPSKSINEGTLLIQDGNVINVGKTVAIPKNTVIIDLKNKKVKTLSFIIRV